MTRKKLMLMVVLLLVLGPIGLFGQNSLNAAGGTAIGNDGIVSYSVGQVFYNTYNGIKGFVVQGVQQPSRNSRAGLRNAEEKVELMLTAYPNPSIDYLTLKVKSLEKTNMIYQLYDMNGKLLKKGKMTNNETQIILNDLIPSSYLLKVTDNKKEIKTFRITKN